MTDDDSGALPACPADVDNSDALPAIVVMLMRLVRRVIVKEKMML
jgi:hypothetical protein